MSWNVGGVADSGVQNISPEQNQRLVTMLSSLIFHGIRSDILVFGLQEIVELTSPNMWIRKSKQMQKAHSASKAKVDKHVEGWVGIILKSANEAVKKYCEEGELFQCYETLIYICGMMLLILVKGGVSSIRRQMS